MPMRHGGRLASRASTWPRDHFWRNTRAPRRSWPTMWNEFLPISMPITASLLLSFSDMACSFVFRCPLASLARWQGLEHGRTIPFCMVRPCDARGFVDLVDAVLHYCIRPLIGASAPGHHGYQRACDLILGQASNGLVGSPVFARAGKTDHSNVVLSSRRPRRVNLAKLSHR